MTFLHKLFSNAKKEVPSLHRAGTVFVLVACSIVFWELFLHMTLLEGISWRFLYVALFSFVFATAITLMTGLLSRVGNAIGLWLCMGVLYLLYAVQLIYYQIFGGFMSVYLIQMGGDAVTSFFKETMGCIRQNWWRLVIMVLPLVVTGLCLKKKWILLERCSWRCSLRQVLACILLHLVCLWCLPLGGTEAYTVYGAYYNANTSTDASISNLGILTTFRLELKGILFGGSAEKPGVNMEDIVIPTIDINDLIGPVTKPTDPIVPTGPVDPTDPTAPTVPEITYTDQTLEIDFDALIAQAQQNGDTTMAALHQYFAAQTPTKTNDFTGLFRDKNLIYLVCESFSPVVISQEMTPTLYKLYNEGIKFTNFYGSFKNTTTNGEYAACLGIFPDMSRAKDDGSFVKSKNNYLPFALGNMFGDQQNVDSHFYHNFKGNYYGRNQTHPNLGYSTLKFMGAGMKFTYSWPSSDLEMMQQSVKDYVNKDRFHAYYMTFSGHYAYDFSTNPMCTINKEATDHLSYSETVRAYIACHLELEKALAYLMEQLEMAGKLEDTVIVLTSDHYPYGLNNKQYSELAGEKKDTAFGIYENAFICWSYGMEEAIVVDTPCCTVDILPTLLNLFGLQYDSRLLIGQDVLDPNSLHIATLYNGSFITDRVKFNSATGQVTYLVDEALVPAGYVEAIHQIVQNRFTISKAILDYDYYRVVFKPEE